jgi:hypothetical protein
MSSVPTKLTDRFVETAIDDEIVLMRLSDGDFFSLDETGRSIWLAIDGSRNRAAIVSKLAEAYDCSPETILADVNRFIDELVESGIVAG